MGRPRLLDLFCGAGGAAVGYHRAGFDVVGVDIAPQPRYPFEFVQGDAFETLRCMIRGDWQFDAIHASPVCKLWSAATPAWARQNHPDQLTPCRALLQQLAVPWVIENVPGAPMRADYNLCGCMFGLPKLRRERWFETSWHAFELRPPCHHPERAVTVAGHGIPSGSWYLNRVDGYEYSRLARAAMGIGWMTRDELAQAIPPAYTEHIGRQLIDALAVAHA